MEPMAQLLPRLRLQHWHPSMPSRVRPFKGRNGARINGLQLNCCALQRERHEHDPGQGLGTASCEGRISTISGKHFLEAATVGGQ